jgi:hypothetical protein
MISARHPTDELIESLVSKLRPVPRAAVGLRLAFGVTAGVAVSVLLLFLLIGARPDLGVIIQSARFWAKASYMLATAGVALLVAARLARPGSNKGNLWIVAFPILAYLPVGIWELAHTDPSQWVSLLLGYGWRLCTWLILMLSVPIYAGLWWAYRSFAPTRIEAAGAVTGLCASAIAAVVYCLHCPTDTAIFALTWYTLAFAIASSVGAVLGRRLLRW